MVLLNKIAIENFLEQTVLYSKLVRGKLPFKAEVHVLDNGQKIQLYLYRDHERIEEFIKVGQAKNILTEQNAIVESEIGVLRLTINEDRFMINSAGKSTITIKEINFNHKETKIQDFPHGKVAIFIDIDFEDGTDNSKFKKEIKDYFTEVQNGEQSD